MLQVKSGAIQALKSAHPRRERSSTPFDVESDSLQLEVGVFLEIVELNGMMIAGSAVIGDLAGSDNGRVPART